MSHYKQIDGCRYDKDMIDAADAAIKDAGEVNVENAKAILDATLDGNKYTPCEKKTMKYIRNHYKITAAADSYIRHEIASFAAAKAAKKRARSAGGVKSSPAAKKRKTNGGTASDTKLEKEDTESKSEHEVDIPVLDSKKAFAFVEEQWSSTIQDALSKYISIPNQSPQFDKDVFTNGHMDAAIDLLVAWVKEQEVPDLELRVLRADGRTPLIFIEVAGSEHSDETILLYGHMDKQPPMAESWAPGLHPFTPVIRGDHLYGRGSADDGYSIFAAVTAIKSLKHQGVPHARCVLVIEACEESGSKDLEYYMGVLKEDIETPSLVICLDSGAGNYDQIWLTTSLRGMLLAQLKVQLLEEGVHSGSGSGIVASSFRVMRQLLDRIEDSKTGKLIDEAFEAIPDKHQKYAQDTAETLKDQILSEFKLTPGATTLEGSLPELILNRTWRPTLCVTGVDGIPPLAVAGNVLRAHTTLNLSMRLPPSLAPEKLANTVRKILETDPPYGAKVTVTIEKASQGWCAPPLETWLEDSLNTSSTSFFGQNARLWGEGGSIPFMGMLGRMYPKTQFVITGVLGPGSNAHGPNEFLHIPMFKKITCCVSQIIADHFKHTLHKPADVETHDVQVHDADMAASPSSSSVLPSSSSSFSSIDSSASAFCSSAHCHP